MKQLLRVLTIVALLIVPTAALAPESPSEFVPSEEIPADSAIALPVDI